MFRREKMLTFRQGSRLAVALIALLLSGCGEERRGNPTAWVVTPENTADSRRLTVSRTYRDAWVVTAGLEPGEKVIVEGLQNIRQGAPVRVADVAWEPAD